MRPWLLVIFLSSALICKAGDPASALNRIVDHQPDARPFVRTDLGYMVPYQQRVPGTDTSILMIPVPGSTDANGAMIEPYWMGRYEITVEQFAPYTELYETVGRDRDVRWEERHKGAGAVVVSVDAVTAPTEVYDPSFRFEYSSKPDSPVPSMTQFAARQYTKWLSAVTGVDYCLPTLTQWQDACRGGTETPWSFDDRAAIARKFCVYADPSTTGITLRVGRTLPNPYGLCDMHGSLAEWVIDDVSGKQHYQTHPMCGGSFQDDLKDCRWDSIKHCTARYWAEDPNLPLSPWWLASTDAVEVGFRIISPLQKMTDEQKRERWESDSEQLTRDLQQRMKEGRGRFVRVTKD
ncbi:formylglycine-generating enzyme family protein [Stieleria varia]|uniref:Formylglycine-generating sulfatase enzyme n=1 Tax=Stieleria varia TaxID=2528005 RepID=A0A5C6ASE7_9BACT|nr:SUMF1/EgtB/PvdO family nonheme iron enzyme [Stieleria varia]TWU02610.1 Formylglycine-generating sulfatase enzyme [Stieleria varia]